MPDFLLLLDFIEFFDKLDKFIRSSSLSLDLDLLKDLSIISIPAFLIGDCELLFFILDGESLCVSEF